MAVGLVNPEYEREIKALKERVEKLEQRVKELEKKLHKIPGLRYDPDTGAILVQQEGD